MHDQLKDGRKIRSFNANDDFNRKALDINVDFSLPSERVICALAQIIAWRGKHAVIRAENGPGLVSSKLMECAAKHQIHITHIQPAIPQQDTYVERSNRTVRYEWHRSITGKALSKFKSLQRSGCINTIIIV